MTIKKDCVVKYLKHDFREIGIASGVIIAVVPIIALVVNFVQNHPVVISANLVFDILSGVNILFFIFAPAMLNNYTFGYRRPLISSLLVEFVIIAYYYVIGFEQNYPGVFPDIIVSAILLVIGVPIASAIARCKE